MKKEGNICHVAPGCRAITSLSLAQKMNLEQLVAVTLHNIN